MIFDIRERLPPPSPNQLEGPSAPSYGAQAAGATAVLPLADAVDLVQERARLTKEMGKTAGEITKLEGKLGNQQFVAKAPPEVVEEQQDRLAAALQTRRKLETALERLAGI